mmetsp:Transcript_29414/g.46710  ORF Transcript_29414/g.46710 Transcript_29414/m.46710 type:complete len:1007 (+) Transcript_29414:22-3042(+)
MEAVKIENGVVERTKAMNKRQSQSGSLAYGKISDSSDSFSIDDWKRMQNIRVIARFRPANKREIAWGKAKNVSGKPPFIVRAQQISLEYPNANKNSADNKSFTCTLDAVLSQQCTQKQVFYRCGLPMIMACLAGYNATIFAYGQSGSGKTYTMMGPETNVQSADDFGLVPRCIIYLFQKLDEQLSCENGGTLQDYIVNMECLQIYKSQISDLLNPKSKKKLVIKTNFSTDSVFVQNLRSVQVQTVEESFKLLTAAQQNRIVAGHSLNEVSSRSHMLIILTVIQRSVDGTLKTSKLNFGDLAGSEDLTKALGKNCDPQRKKEAICINRSLSALTTAVSYLSRGKKPGFRDSPLTHILKDSLGGNSKTIMLVTASPHIYNRAESIRTLRFASTAKKVKNKAIINEEQSMNSLKKKIKDLERQNSKLRQDLVTKQSKLSSNKARAGSILRFNASDSTKHEDEEKVQINEEEPEAQAAEIAIEADEVGGDLDVENNVDGKPRKRALSVSCSQHTHNSALNEDEWGSDEDEHDIVRDLHDKHDSEHSDEEESNFELHEYINQLNEYREKLDREQEENDTLQSKIDEKNLELESCTNKIAQLIDELNQNEQEFCDSRHKIRQLQGIVLQYQQQFPSFKPELNSSSASPPLAVTQKSSPIDIALARRSTISSSLSSVNLNSNSVTPLLLTNAAPVDEHEPAVPDLMIPRSRMSRQDSILHTNLLENLLKLQQRMESKINQTEFALHELKLRNSQSLQLQHPKSNPVPLFPSNSLRPIATNHSSRKSLNDRLENVYEHQEYLAFTPPVALSARGSQQLDKLETLDYESADEKLSEWDLDVSTAMDLEVVSNHSSHDDPNENPRIRDLKQTETNVDDMRPDKISVSASPPSIMMAEEEEHEGEQPEKAGTMDSSVSSMDLNAKQMRQHLQSMSRNEKKLKNELAEKLKQDATTATGWCQCFWKKPPKEDEDGGATRLIEEYLRMQVKKRFVKDRYHKKKQQGRAKNVRKRTSNAK